MKRDKMQDEGYPDIYPTLPNGASLSYSPPLLERLLAVSPIPSLGGSSNSSQNMPLNNPLVLSSTSALALTTLEVHLPWTAPNPSWETIREMKHITTVRNMAKQQKLSSPLSLTSARSQEASGKRYGRNDLVPQDICTFSQERERNYKCWK